MKDGHTISVLSALKSPKVLCKGSVVIPDSKGGDRDVWRCRC